MEETKLPLLTASNRQMYVGLFVLAVISYAAFIAVGYSLIGVVVYFVCCAAGVVYHISRNRPLFDERDRALRGTAAARTLNLLGTAVAIGFPAAIAYYAMAAPDVDWPPWLFWLGVYTFGLYLFYSLILIYTHYTQ